jgi:hypothetical protein
MAVFIPELYGRSIKEIARICGVDVSTARRWKRGAICLPYTARVLLEADLGCFDAKWSGWRLQSGLLVSPEGWSATPGEVRSLQLLRAQLASYRTENRALKEALEEADAAGFEEQPLPTQWEIAVG